MESVLKELYNLAKVENVMFQVEAIGHENENATHISISSNGALQDCRF